jgi:hypothetical protein
LYHHKNEPCMNILRYSIRKKELHELLAAIGVLRKSETLLFVDNRDLLNPESETVTATVTVDGEGEDDKYRRFVQLAFLHDALSADLVYVVNEIKKLVKEREAQTQEKGNENDPIIPETIEKSIRDQIQRILSASADDDAKKN